MLTFRQNFGTVYIHTVADSLTFQVYLSQIYATWLFILLYIYELIYCTISLCDIWISLICLKRQWLYSWKEIRVKYSKLPKTLISSKQLCNLDNCFLLSGYDLFSMYIKLINIIYIELIYQCVYPLMLSYVKKDNSYIIETSVAAYSPEWQRI